MWIFLEEKSTLQPGFGLHHFRKCDSALIGKKEICPGMAVRGFSLEGNPLSQSQ